MSAAPQPIKPLWRQAAPIIAVTLPATILFVILTPPNVENVGIASGILQPLVSAQFMILLALAAWSAERLPVRCCAYGGTLLLHLTLLHATNLLHPRRAAFSLREISSTAAALILLSLLRICTGWRLGPAGKERRLSIADCLVGISLIGVVLGFGSAAFRGQLAENFQALRLLGLTLLLSAGGMFVSVPPLAWLVFRARVITALLTLSALSLLLTTAGVFLVRRYGIRELPDTIHLAGGLWLLTSAYLATWAGCFGWLRSRGVQLHLGWPRGAESDFTTP